MLKTKLLKKFRGRFIITRDPDSPENYRLIDLDKKRVYVYFVAPYKIDTLQKAIYLGCSKVTGPYELQGIYLAHKKRRAEQAFRKALKDAIIEP